MAQSNDAFERLLQEADLPLPSPYGGVYFIEYLNRYKKFAESYHALLKSDNDCEVSELQTLRQRNAELEADIGLCMQNHGNKTLELIKAQDKILSQQPTIEKMRDDWDDLLEDLEIHGMHSFEPYIKSKAKFKAIPLQSSAEELAKHDEQVRVEEREACAKLANEWADARVKPICYALNNLATAIRQRKIS
ncbi:MAG: hypothetical protein PHT07_20775 [Paludibacter sp.]|nr:hypothetical protein [Paludibacter sp.]